MNAKLKTRAATRKTNETLEAYLAYCWNDAVSPEPQLFIEPQLIIDAVEDASDSDETLVSYLAASLVMDVDSIRQAGLALAEAYGISSNEVKALRRRVGDAGKRAAALGYQPQSGTGLDLDRLTIKFEKEKGKPVACNVETSRKQTRPARPGGNAETIDKAKSESKPAKPHATTDHERFLDLVKSVGLGQIEDWAAEYAAEQASMAEAARSIPGKPASHARH